MAPIPMTPMRPNDLPRTIQSTTNVKGTVVTIPIEATKGDVMAKASKKRVL